MKKNKMLDEGYIKFNCIWKKKEFQSKENIKDLLYWRDRMLEFNAIGEDLDETGQRLVKELKKLNT